MKLCDPSTVRSGIGLSATTAGVLAAGPDEQLLKLHKDLTEKIAASEPILEEQPEHFI